jgi:Cof subfamily protein (haloacid dehalogenase superfamily)
MGQAVAFKLILIDVDGTFLGKHGAHPSTWAALDAARHASVHLGLCTGRPGAGTALEYAREVAPDDFHIFHSGAIVSQPGRPAAYRSALPRETYERLVRLSRQEGVPLEAYTDSAYSLERETDLTRVHAKHLELTPLIRDLFEIEEPIIRAQWVVHERDWPPLRKLTAELEEVEISPATAPWSPGTVFANLTHRGTSKAAAMRWLAAHYGIEPGQVAMVGDGENDLDAIQAAGLGIAMGNAPTAVKAQARAVVSDADHGGLAEAIRLVLNGGPR